MAKKELEVAVKFLTKDVLLEKESVVFTLANGTSLEAELARIPQKTVTRLALHGLSQKVGDSTSSLSKNNEYGAAFEAMTGVYAALCDDRWTVGRESVGTADLVTVLSKLKGVPIADVQAAVAKADYETIAKWMKNEQVKAGIRELQAERARALAKNVTVDDIDLGI